MKMPTKQISLVITSVFTTLLSFSVLAQLTDATQTFPSVPGGAIAKSLQQQIGSGRGSEFVPGSSIYLIKRDPARSIRRGRQLFQRKFTLNQGLGPRVDGDSSGDISANGALGAGLADSCAACHGRPRGAAGFGGDVATRPDSRDAPHLFGLGLVEMLADEITRDLRQQRDRALAQAQTLGLSVVVRLRSKGVRYGEIEAFPNGNTDITRLEGVDDDLRVRPFFHDGRTISIREFIVGAFNDEMGLQTADPLLCAVTDPRQPSVATSPAGMVFDPQADAFERPPVCDAGEDKDADGVVNEIDPALLDHMEFYLLNYFKPGLGRQTRRTAQGRFLLKLIGCTGCHKENLKIDQDRRVADVETRFDPQRGIFNRLFATVNPQFSVTEDGEAFPLLLPNQGSFVVRHFYSDLKRHDLGPAFHERQYDGSLVTEFLTEPLWGVGSTAPYGHDGRSINLREVILRHGGEAASSRNVFARLGDSNQRKILEFLETLILFPPDDTASSLNPGVPFSDNPQNPDEHGSIELRGLFQIPGEGPE